MVRDDGNRFSGKADKDVVAIKFADGTVWKAADVYVNVYDNRERLAAAARPSARVHGRTSADGWRWRRRAARLRRRRRALRHVFRGVS